MYRKKIVLVTNEFLAECAVNDHAIFDIGTAR